MNDAFERRALLLHLGEVLEAIHCITRKAHAHSTVGAALESEVGLSDFPLLGVVASGMSTPDFVQGATGAFFRWPKELLEATLNRRSLAETVQRSLFAGNPEGWGRYIGLLQLEVPWFGLGLPSVSPGRDVSTQGDENTASDRRRGWPWED